MRPNLLRAVVALGGLVVTASAAATLAVGCSGDDSLPAAVGDSGLDGTTDSHADVVVQPDSPNADVQQDVRADVGDSGSPDAPALVDFPLAVDLAYCKRLQQCCLVGTSAWDLQKCIVTFQGNAGVEYEGLYQGMLDAGGIAYDTAKAAQCLTIVSGTLCGTIGTTAVNQIRQNCAGAMSGTLTVGTACATSIQCAPGAYCKNGADGGACAALLGVGADCRQQGDVSCTYLGIPGADYCDTSVADAATCAAGRALDAGCSRDQMCQSGLCVYGMPTTCGATSIVSDPGVPNGFCDYLTIKDAGGGG